MLTELPSWRARPYTEKSTELERPAAARPCRIASAPAPDWRASTNRSAFAKTGTFFASAGVVQTFGVNNIETAEWLSKTLGQTTIEYATMQHGTSKTGVFSGSKTPGTSQQFTGRSLLIPDEVMHLPDDEQILMVKGMPPVAARKLRYFADKEFKGLFEPSG